MSKTNNSISILKAKNIYSEDLKIHKIIFNPLNLDKKQDKNKSENIFNFNNIFKKAKDHLNNKEYEKSLNLFLSIYSKKKDSIIINYYIGLIYSKKESFTSAINFFNRVLQVLSQDNNSIKKYNYIYIHVKFILAYIYISQKEFKKAENLIKEYQQYNFKSKNSFYLNILGYIYYIKKEYIKSKLFYEHIISFDKSNSTAYNMLGYIYLKKNPKEIDKALYYYQKALEIDPNHSYYLDSMGLAFQLKNNDLKAIEYLKLAYEKNPMNNNIKLKLKKLLSSSY